MEDILRMDISAGIVLFNPDIKRLKENIDAVIVQCTHVYLVDNGSGNIDEVLELLKKYKKSKISVICNAKKSWNCESTQSACQCCTKRWI